MTARRGSVGVSQVSIALILGRDGMGPEADEADFEAWFSYVCDHIDEATGLDVDVQIRAPRDVQVDDVRGYLGEKSDVLGPLQDLWEQFCANPNAWPTR